MSSFPASKYARYKRATAFFLDWLLRARGRGRHAGKRVELETFSGVVQEIAQDPSTLTPKLLQDLPKALAACQCAITLRERVATFFAEDDKAQDGHEHFLQLLRSWRDALKDIGVEQPGPVEQTTKFENYFAVMEVDEDFFPDEETFVKDRGATKKAKADRKKLFDEAFTQDLQMEVVCYFMELEELVEGVFNIYDEVKKQKRTMMEATVVVTLALHMANALTAKLQLRYPELKLADDLVGVLVCYPSASLGAQIATAVAEVRESFEKDGTAKFVPGTLLHDFTNVFVTLSIFSNVFRPLGVASSFVGLPEGYFGANYGEERTPEYVFPDVNHYVVLLSQQLPHLYNMILVKRAEMGPGLDGQMGLVVDFMNLLEKYFETRQVTIPLVFLCICWMQSVAALQGDAGLSRNISLTIKHTEDLIEVVEAAMSKNPLPVPVKGDSYHALLRDTRDGYMASLRSNNLARANPLFAGSQMMSNHLEYLIVGNSYITQTCRAFCHLYNALVKQGFLKHIQFFDEMLEIYGGMIFARSSHAAAERGSYNRVYLLAMNVTGSSIDAMYDSGSFVGTFNRNRMENADPNMLSQTYRLMDDDMSFLKGVASKAMLQKAADVCTKEMFESRILSRDLMTLNDDVEEVFSVICDDLGRQAIRDDYVAHFPAGMPREVKLKRALELTVMVPLLSLVDGLQPDGSLDSSLIPELQVIGDVVVDGDFVRRMLSVVAAVIESRFTSEICAEKYFTFPSRPDFAAQEYGSVSFKVKTKNDYREQVFTELMDHMKSSKGPLTGTRLHYVKENIKKDPELLGMFLPCSPSNALTEDDDLCTLFHQAAAGPAHDAKLVEWMIQLGALFTQPLHCRKEPREGDLTCARKLLPNTMAVHSAAIAGYESIMMLILEADNFVDLNTPTFHTKATLAHLAVKNGHKGEYSGIHVSGADMRIKDGKGRNVWDMTNDRKWSQQIAEVAAKIEECCRRGRGRKEPPRFIDGALIRLAARMRKLVFAKRGKELRLAMADLDLYDAVESKKKTKTTKRECKKKAKANVVLISSPAPVPEVDTSATTKFVAALLGTARPATNNKTGSPNGSGRNAVLQASLQKTMSAFARLRDPSIPVEDKFEDIQRICKVLHKLDEATEVQSDPNKMIGTGVVLRIDVSLEASQVIHMMHKFYNADRAAISVPELAPVRELCATTLDFVKFVVRTAWISLSVDRKPQTAEVLSVLEKRLLKTPFAEREPPKFRAMVQLYSKERDSMKLGRTSSPDTFRRLEWYLHDAVQNPKLLSTFDKMVGQPHYFVLAMAPETSDQQITRTRTAIDALPALDGVACFGRRRCCVMYGASGKDRVAVVRNLVLETASGVGIQFDEHNSQDCTASLRIGEFEFSNAGAFRNAARA